jgi:photosystem II stability/assembly factor-like uncharacterized protein
MKHLLAFLAVFVLFSSDASGQKPYKWRQLKGPNVGSTYHSLTFDESGNIIIVDSKGYSKSTDNGLSWDYHKILQRSLYESNSSIQSGLTVISSTESYFYCSPYYYSEDDDLAGVYRSTNGGNTWEHVLKNYGVIQVFHDNNNALFVITWKPQPLLFKSIDKGTSWIQVSQLDGNPFKIIGSENNFLYLFNGYNLFRMDYSNFIRQSYDPLRKGHTYGNTYAAAQLEKNFFIASDGVSNVFTSDGENEWDSVAVLSGPFNFAKGNGDTLYALNQGNDQNVQCYFSPDRGKHWQYFFELPFRSRTTNAISFSNPKRLIFENDSGLYLSLDKGKSWKEIGVPIDSIVSIKLSTDGDKIFALDAPDQSNGYEYYRSTNISTDKGETWNATSPSVAPINGIGKGLNGSIFAIGPDSIRQYVNSIWSYVPNNPLQWKRLSVVELLGKQPLTATDGSKSIYLASGNIILRSDDNAFSWLDVTAPNTGNNISSIDASTDGTVYFGTYPIMYRSDDHGDTWTKLIPTHEIVKLSYIKTFDKDGVLLGTEGAGLLLSTDKGNNWTRIDGNNFDTVTCIAVNSKGEVAAGTNRGLWTSDVTKQQWTKVTLGNDANLYIGGIDVAKNDDFYVGTYGSSVWMGTRNYNSANFAFERSTSLKIFPNPASGNVTISLPSDESKIELYDILGRKISVLNGLGDGQIHFNTGNLSNGIYTISLRGQKNETQKLIVNH